MKLVITEAYIASVTNLTENHGEDLVDGKAIKIECQVAPAVLDQFSPKLRDVFFENDIPTIPELGTLNWTPEYEKAHFQIGSMKFTKADVKKIKFAMRAGFLADLEFFVKVLTTEEQGGKLDAMQKRTVKVTLEKMTQKRLDDPAEPKDGEDKDGNGSQAGLPNITPLRPDLSTKH